MARNQAERALLFLCAWVAVAAVLHLAGCGGARPSRETQPPPVSDGKTRPYKVLGKWYRPITDASGFVEYGKASWYGRPFHGRRTANGETYDMYGLSAAHKILPLGTFVRVRNLENDRELDVRINDRGPFVQGRVIDLSYGAARKLGVAEKGLAEVRLTALGTPSRPEKSGAPPVYVPVDFRKGNFTFQVGAFREIDNARRLREKLERTYRNAHIVTYDSGAGVFYRVRVGRFSTLDLAEARRHLLEADGYPNLFIVAE